MEQSHLYNLSPGLKVNAHIINAHNEGNEQGSIPNLIMCNLTLLGKFVSQYLLQTTAAAKTMIFVITLIKIKSIFVSVPSRISTNTDRFTRNNPLNFSDATIQAK